MRLFRKRVSFLHLSLLALLIVVIAGFVLRDAAALRAEVRQVRDIMGRYVNLLNDLRAAEPIAESAVPVDPKDYEAFVDSLMAPKQTVIEEDVESLNETEHLVDTEDRETPEGKEPDLEQESSTCIPYSDDDVVNDFTTTDGILDIGIASAKDLREYCRSRGLPISGSKGVLLERIERHRQFEKTSLPTEDRVEED